MHKYIPYSTSLSAFIDKIRKNMLGYSHQTFSQLLDASMSTSFYLCGGSRGSDNKKRARKSTRHMNTDFLYRIFIMAYNAHIFSERYDEMANLLNKAKRNKTTKIKSLESLFGSKNSLRSELNPHQLVIPYEIFKKSYDNNDSNKFGDFNMDYRETITSAFDSIFSNEHFNDGLQYMHLCLYEQLTPADKIKLDSFIVKLLINEYSEFNEREKRESKWLYLLYFFHSIVTIHPNLEKYINNGFLNKNGYHCDWNEVFKKLSNNDNIKSMKENNDECIYFEDETNQIEKNNLPIIYYQYYHPTSSSNYDYYSEDVLLAKKGQIRLIHLYMILFNIYRNNNSESDSFIKSCYMIGSYGTNVLFDDSTLGLYTPPSSPIINLVNDNQLEFNNMLHDFFKKANLDPNNEEDIDLINFRENRNQGLFSFMRTISFDFEIIRYLNKGMAEELREELKKTVQRYKKQNKL